MSTHLDRLPRIPHIPRIIPCPRSDSLTLFQRRGRLGFQQEGGPRFGREAREARQGLILHRSCQRHRPRRGDDVTCEDRGIRGHRSAETTVVSATGVTEDNRGAMWLDVVRRV